MFDCWYHCYSYLCVKGTLCFDLINKLINFLLFAMQKWVITGQTKLLSARLSEKKTSLTGSGDSCIRAVLSWQGQPKTVKVHGWGGQRIRNMFGQAFSEWRQLKKNKAAGLMWTSQSHWYGCKITLFSLFLWMLVLSPWYQLFVIFFLHLFLWSFAGLSH